jgi:hypothetical protein
MLAVIIIATVLHISMRILPVLLLVTLMVSCTDRPQEQSAKQSQQVIKCWERYLPDEDGEQRSCDTIDIAMDSTAAVTVHGDIRNRTAFAHRMERLLNVGTGNGFQQFVRDTTYCLVRQKESMASFNGDSVTIALYTIEGCRQEKPVALGRLIFADRYGMIGNLGEMGSPIIAASISKGGELIELRELINVVFADTTLLPKQPASTNQGEE